jgi:hypothetical protein
VPTAYAKSPGNGACAGGKNAANRLHRLGIATFVQILAKLHFFKLLENLRIILLDYGQKRSCTANAAFKAAC